MNFISVRSLRPKWFLLNRVPGFSRLEGDLLESLEVLDRLTVHASAGEGDVGLGDNSIEKIVS